MYLLINKTFRYITGIEKNVKNTIEKKEGDLIDIFSYLFHTLKKIRVNITVFLFMKTLYIDIRRYVNATIRSVQ